jgi:hypothetical protein
MLMSPYLHYEIVRARQHEIATRLTEARHVHEVQADAGRTRRFVKSRVGHAIAALGVLLAAGR